MVQVRKAFFALIANGVRSAPLWDAATQDIIGMYNVARIHSVFFITTYLTICVNKLGLKYDVIVRELSTNLYRIIYFYKPIYICCVSVAMCTVCDQVDLPISS